MERRTFLRAAIAAGAIGASWQVGRIDQRRSWRSPPSPDSAARDCPDFDWSGDSPHAHAVIPVVGDGDWIWEDPPQGETGYLDSRDFLLEVGIEARATGYAENFLATTPVPVEFPEQSITSSDVQADGCRAGLRQLTPEAGQLVLSAERIAPGQVATARAEFRLTLRKDYRGFTRDQFEYELELPKDVRRKYLHDSPGIQTRSKMVTDLAGQLVRAEEHPWDKARCFYQWVRDNIEGRPQNYTSVVAAVRDRIGDCEERAATFVALCRAAGIPARLVWVPNHNWAEFGLLDRSGQFHWIPSHTSCYSWFGWTGAHELVIQKGDRIPLPEKKRPERLMSDWMHGGGSRPEVRYLARLTPLPATAGADPGPGARQKNRRGGWEPLEQHPLDRYLRDGSRVAESMPRELAAAHARNRGQQAAVAAGR